MAKKDKLNEVDKEISDEQEGSVITPEISQEVIEDTSKVSESEANSKEAAEPVVESVAKDEPLVTKPLKESGLIAGIISDIKNAEKNLEHVLSSDLNTLLLKLVELNDHISLCEIKFGAKVKVLADKFKSFFS